MAVSSSRAASISGGQSFSGSKTYTGDKRISMNFQVADGLADDQHPVTVDIDQLQMFVMMSDEDVTVKWNDAAGTQGSVSLKAKVPWVELVAADQYQTTKFGVDVTDFFITNLAGGAATANIWIEIIQNDAA